MTALSDQASSSIRSALNAEHAAVWVYGLAAAYCTAQRVQSAVNDGTEEHQVQRDAAERVLQAAGQTPPPPQVEYALPTPVTDQTSAINAMVTAETDCQTGWLAVLETTDDTGLRRTALDSLTTSAVRATRWRLTVGAPQPAPAFPGMPTQS